ARIAVASNPFEITSLRMARAELLAGPLGNHAAAKAELGAILHKEPQHGRALARLSDLQYDDGAYAEAAETYLGRALVERPAEQDAAGPGSERAVPYLIRLGQLWEQSGDLRRAGVRFRQAADAAPRNVQAVGEMVRHFERTRDPLGRRALLDNALLLLRGDLQAGKLDLASLRALVSIQQWRGKAAAAAARPDRFHRHRGGRAAPGRLRQAGARRRGGPDDRRAGRSTRADPRRANREDGLPRRPLRCRARSAALLHVPRPRAARDPGGD